MSVQIGEISDLISKFFNANNYSSVLVIVDENTKKYCLPSIKEIIPKHSKIKIKSGENHKTLHTCEKIWEKMTKSNFDRHALVINLGGGVIGDMGGFCAACYKRGVDFIQIPTTLLSQVDASVGGKLGIDFQGFKNQIGSFQMPKKVFIDPAFLNTLPKRELRSGFAEIIKHCLIKDKNEWDKVRSTDFENQNFPELIKHSVAIKQEIVKEDPKENGIRKILNFGHTIGHAIETYFLNTSKKPLLHGEAIAVGMICEAYLSHQILGLPEKDLNEIEEYIYSTYGKVNLKEKSYSAILKLLKQDKKNKDGLIRFSLLKNIGDCQWDIVVNLPQIRESLKYYIK